MSRVSTFGSQSAAINQILARQAEAARTQQQLATGRKLVSAKDNPVAAGMAIALQRAEAEFERYGANSATLDNRLRLQENALTSASEMIMRLREITVQANSAVLDLDARNALLPEVRQLREQLFAVANSGDGQGRHLFGGTDDASAPFAFQGGQLQYLGDQTQRRIEVTPELAIADTEPGHRVFVRVPTGDGVASVRAEAGNAGTGVIANAGWADQGQWTGGAYTLRFEGGDYELLDAGGTVLGAGPYVPGGSVTVAGYRVAISGMPADGDSFRIGPAPTRDIFATIDALEATLRTANTPATTNAERQNGFYAALEDLDRAAQHFIDVRASGGARLASLDAAANEREARLLSTRSTLSDLRDLDYADAIGRLTREMATLEAAQLSFQRIQSTNLFQLLR